MRAIMTLLRHFAPKKQIYVGAEHRLMGILAEAVRFELTGPFEPPVFKTGAIDHSATLPAGGIVTLF
jgi:hypothetical protein